MDESTKQGNAAVEQIIAQALLAAQTTVVAKTEIVRPVHVTFFKDFAANSLTTDTVTLADLSERVLNASARKKDRLPWLKMAMFGMKRTDRNSLRHDANVDQITGVEIDYDDEKIAFDDVLTVLRELGVQSLLYTSPSYTLAAPRWRVLAPTLEPLAPEMHNALLARLNGFLKARLGAERIAKGESFALSQAYYYGWVCDAPKPHHRAEVIVGDFIDQREDLAQYEALGAKSENAGSGGANNNTTGNSNTTGNGTIDWTSVENYIGWLKSANDSANFNIKGKAIIAHSGTLGDLNFDLSHGGILIKPYQSWSEVSFALASIFKSDGRFSNEQIAAVLMADLDCNRHITSIADAANKRRAIERLILRSYTQTQTKTLYMWTAATPNWRELRKDGSPVPACTMHGSPSRRSPFNAAMICSTTNCCLVTKTTVRATWLNTSSAK